LFNLVRNSVVRLPSSVINDQGTGTYPAAPVVHSECGTLCCRSPLPWSCGRWWVGCSCGWLSLGNPPIPVVLPSGYVKTNSWIISLWVVQGVQRRPVMLKDERLTKASFTLTQILRCERIFCILNCWWERFVQKCVLSLHRKETE